MSKKVHSLQKIILNDYSELLKNFDISNNDSEITTTIDFSNLNYSLWFSEFPDGTFIVGVNDHHLHFDSEQVHENFHQALEYIKAFLFDELVIVSLTKEKSNNILAIMETSEALKYYEHEKPQVQLVSFTQDY